jgi:hypothetical protein
METKPPLIVRIPGIFVSAGIVIFALAGSAKELPDRIGLSPLFQLPCAFFSSVLIPFGSLLALHALISQTSKRRTLLWWHLIGPLFLIGVLSLYFYVSFVIQRVTELAAPPNILPKLAENARVFPNADKRMLQAKWAYRLYGVTLAYTQDNSQVAFYQPTEADRAKWAEMQNSKQAEDKTLQFIAKFLDQLPYLFALYASTFIATSIAGGVWLTLRLPRGVAPKLTIQH